VGPTASGKTDLLFDLFAAPERRFFCAAEIISADSMQVYRGMDIGTAKPSLADRGRLPHHLIDILEPSQQYSAGDFVRLADEALSDISARGSLPVISGGTGFYVKNLVCGLPSAPASDPELRAQVAADLAARGPDLLRAELRAGDPASAARIHEHDLYRLARAVEVLRGTGRPLSDFAASSKTRADRDFLVVELTRPREELYARIDARVERMFARGLAAEVEALRARGLGPEDPGMKAIGYREFFETGLSQPEIVELVKRDSRRYAKRQETFFKGLPGLTKIEISGENGVAEASERLKPLLEAFLSK
jgi:tRNA dimethylallyltransferase